MPTNKNLQKNCIQQIIILEHPVPLHKFYNKNN
jgi:hypothetical protein